MIFRAQETRPLTQNELKTWRELGRRRVRRSEQAFLAEGVRLIDESLRADVQPEIVLYQNELAAAAQDLVAQLMSQGVPTRCIPQRQLERIADTETSQGLLARYRMHTVSPAELFTPRARTVVLIDSVIDPGNLGTLIRSAIAFGVSDIAIAGDGAADPFGPKVVRATSGALFRSRIAIDEREEIRNAARTAGYIVVVADLDGFETWPEPDPEHMLLIIGGETAGVNRYWRQSADHIIAVRQTDRIDSLNAAIAGSILMHGRFVRG